MSHFITADAAAADDLISVEAIPMKHEDESTLNFSIIFTRQALRNPHLSGGNNDKFYIIGRGRSVQLRVLSISLVKDSASNGSSYHYVTSMIFNTTLPDEAQKCKMGSFTATKTGFMAILTNDCTIHRCHINLEEQGTVNLVTTLLGPLL